MSEPSRVDLVFLWHHHQPDYRRPSDRRAQLPWVRLHATKDYLDMALRLERHPGVRAGFNFVPALVDQLEDAVSGAPDALFELLSRPIAGLAAEGRRELARRCRAAPRHALERWSGYRRLIERVGRWIAGDFKPPAPSEAELLALSCWFLLAWLDPMFLAEPEAMRALAHAESFAPADRDGLLAVHARLTAEVLPAYRRLAGRGQIELSASPYCHPILPLLVDLKSARRARPELALPAEPLAAPEDARRQIERAIARHAGMFGAAPTGMWPSEGAVSPEAAELAAGAGVRWLASDEGVLWASLPDADRRRERLYRPWRLATAAGDVSFLFRDRELSDRIGFVYARWEAQAAAADFMSRVRRIGAEHGGSGVPLVAVILDGENCWEHYPEDGGPFLDALYGALEAAGDVRTLTPSQALAEHPGEPLPRLHTGSWIDADLHIWIGHPEKNRGWDLLARARRELVEAGPSAPVAAWEALDRAAGSDWFWWFGEDHFTADKALFDQLFRDHLRAIYEALGRSVPRTLLAPIARAPMERHALPPIGWVRPTIDGRLTDFYEWHAAGRHGSGDGGGSMHRSGGLVRDLFHGFDATCLYLRVDFARAPEAGVGLEIELLEPRAVALQIAALARGALIVSAGSAAEPVAGAEARLDELLEIAVPFAALGLKPGEEVAMVLHVIREGETVEELPPGDIVRFIVPGAAADAGLWSA